MNFPLEYQRVYNILVGNNKATDSRNLFRGVIIHASNLSNYDSRRNDFHCRQQVLSLANVSDHICPALPICSVEDDIQCAECSELTELVFKRSAQGTVISHRKKCTTFDQFGNILLNTDALTDHLVNKLLEILLSEFSSGNYHILRGGDLMRLNQIISVYFMQLSKRWKTHYVALSQLSRPTPSFAVPHNGSVSDGQEIIRVTKENSNDLVWRRMLKAGSQMALHCVINMIIQQPTLNLNNHGLLPVTMLRTCIMNFETVSTDMLYNAIVLRHTSSDDQNPFWFDFVLDAADILEPVVRQQLLFGSVSDTDYTQQLLHLYLEIIFQTGCIDKIMTAIDLLTMVYSQSTSKPAMLDFKRCLYRFSNLAQLKPCDSNGKTNVCSISKQYCEVVEEFNFEKLTYFEAACYLICSLNVYCENHFDISFNNANDDDLHQLLFMSGRRRCDSGDGAGRSLAFMDASMNQLSDDQIVDISCSQVAAFFVTERGRCLTYVYGNKEGCLQVLYGAILTEHILSISTHAGALHQLALTSSGSVYVWGFGVDGRLGVFEDGNATKNIDVPVKMNGFGSKSIRSCHVGPENAGVVTIDGCVFVWGVLGRGVSEPIPLHTPTLVQALPGNAFIVHVAMGEEVPCLALDRYGTVYSIYRDQKSASVMAEILLTGLVVPSKIFNLALAGLVLDEKGKVCFWLHADVCSSLKRKKTDNLCFGQPRKNENKAKFVELPHENDIVVSVAVNHAECVILTRKGFLLEWSLTRNMSSSENGAFSTVDVQNSSSQSYSGSLCVRTFALGPAEHLFVAADLVRDKPTWHLFQLRPDSFIIDPSEKVFERLLQLLVFIENTLGDDVELLSQDQEAFLISVFNLLHCQLYYRKDRRLYDLSIEKQLPTKILSVLVRYCELNSPDIQCAINICAAARSCLTCGLSILCSNVNDVVELLVRVLLDSRIVTTSNPEARSNHFALINVIVNQLSRADNVAEILSLADEFEAVDCENTNVDSLDKSMNGTAQQKESSMMKGMLTERAQVELERSDCVSGSKGDQRLSQPISLITVLRLLFKHMADVLTSKLLHLLDPVVEFLSQLQKMVTAKLLMQIVTKDCCSSQSQSINHLIERYSQMLFELLENVVAFSLSQLSCASDQSLTNILADCRLFALLEEWIQLLWTVVSQFDTFPSQFALKWIRQLPVAVLMLKNASHEWISQLHYSTSRINNTTDDRCVLSSEYENAVLEGLKWCIHESNVYDLEKVADGLQFDKEALGFDVEGDNLRKYLALKCDDADSFCTLLKSACLGSFLNPSKVKGNTISNLLVPTSPYESSLKCMLICCGLICDKMQSLLTQKAAIKAGQSFENILESVFVGGLNSKISFDMMENDENYIGTHLGHLQSFSERALNFLSCLVNAKNDDVKLDREDVGKFWVVIDIFVNRKHLFIPSSEMEPHLSQLYQYLLGVYLYHSKLIDPVLKIIDDSLPVEQLFDASLDAFIPRDVQELLLAVHMLILAVVKRKQESGSPYKEICYDPLRKAKLLLAVTFPVAERKSINGLIEQYTCGSGRWKRAYQLAKSPKMIVVEEPLTKSKGENMCMLDSSEKAELTFDGNSTPCPLSRGFSDDSVREDLVQLLANFEQFILSDEITASSVVDRIQLDTAKIDCLQLTNETMLSLIGNVVNDRTLMSLLFSVYRQSSSANMITLAPRWWLMRSVVYTESMLQIILELFKNELDKWNRSSELSQQSQMLLVSFMKLMCGKLISKPWLVFLLNRNVMVLFRRCFVTACSEQNARELLQRQPINLASVKRCSVYPDEIAMESEIAFIDSAGSQLSASKGGTTSQSGKVASDPLNPANIIRSGPISKQLLAEPSLTALLTLIMSMMKHINQLPVGHIRHLSSFLFQVFTYRKGDELSGITVSEKLIHQSVWVNIGFISAIANMKGAEMVFANDYWYDFLLSKFKYVTPLTVHENITLLQWFIKMVKIDENLNSVMIFTRLKAALCDLVASVMKLGPVDGERRLGCDDRFVASISLTAPALQTMINHMLVAVRELMLVNSSFRVLVSQFVVSKLRTPVLILPEQDTENVSGDCDVHVALAILAGLVDNRPCIGLPVESCDCKVTGTVISFDAAKGMAFVKLKLDGSVSSHSIGNLSVDSSCSSCVLHVLFCDSKDDLKFLCGMLYGTIGQLLTVNEDVINRSYLYQIYLTSLVVRSVVNNCSQCCAERIFCSDQANVTDLLDWACRCEPFTDRFDFGHIQLAIVDLLQNLHTIPRMYDSVECRSSLDPSPDSDDGGGAEENINSRTLTQSTIWSRSGRTENTGGSDDVEQVSLLSRAYMDESLIRAATASHPIVEQLVEMGFEAEHVERALQILGRNELLPSAERVVGWLIERNGRTERVETSNRLLTTSSHRRSLNGEVGRNGRRIARRIRHVNGDRYFCRIAVRSSDDESDEVDAVPTTRYPTMPRATLHSVSRSGGGGVRSRSASSTSMSSDTETDLEQELVDRRNWLFSQPSAPERWGRFLEDMARGEGMPRSPQSNVDVSVIRLRVGDRVRYKPEYQFDQSNAAIGIVRCVAPQSSHVIVDFPRQKDVNLNSMALDRVSSSHPGVKCSTCHSLPICGARYICHICHDSFCFSCFNTPSSSMLNQHKNHVFNRYISPESLPENVGLMTEEHDLPIKPNRPKAIEESANGCGSLVSDWLTCVRTIAASSNEDSLVNVIDGLDGSYWRSSTFDCEPWIQLEIYPHISLRSLSVQFSSVDSNLARPMSVNVQCSHSTDMKQCKLDKHFSLKKDENIIQLIDNPYGEQYNFVRIVFCQTEPSCTVMNLYTIGRIKASKMSKFYQITQDCARQAAVITSDVVDPSGELLRGNYEKTKSKLRHRRLGMKAMSRLRSNECKVFTWGLNDKSQLGGELGSKVKVPTYSEALSCLNPISVSGGTKSMFIVSINGYVYSCGEASSGRLGLQFDDEINCESLTINTPMRISSLSSHFITKVAVHSGGKHCLALSSDGVVFSWGDGDDGKLGHGDIECQRQPRLIDGLLQYVVSDVACGSAHSAAVTRDGKLLTWGLGLFGRLGHGSTETRLCPKIVHALEKEHVVQVACGSRDAQTVCLLEDHRVFAWGDGDFGKLGNGKSEGSFVPQNIDALNGRHIVAVYCGAQFSVALGRGGAVWTWGKGDYHRLGHGSDAHTRKPQQVESLRGKKIIYVAVGALHCLALTDKGQVFAWGDNDHGQQGSGTTQVNRRPLMIASLLDYKITMIACGSSHSIAWTLPCRTIRSSRSNALVRIKEMTCVDHVPFCTPVDSLGRLANVSSILTKVKPRTPLIFLAQNVSQFVGTSLVKDSLICLYQNIGILLSRDTMQQWLKWKCNKTQHHLLLRDFDSHNICAFTFLRRIVSFLSIVSTNDYNHDYINNYITFIMQLVNTRPQLLLFLTEFVVSSLERITESDTEVADEVVIQESDHPYLDETHSWGKVSLPGAVSLLVQFDRRCSTESQHDSLSIYDSDGHLVCIMSGRDWKSDWNRQVTVQGDLLYWKFRSDSSVNGWGWKFTVKPSVQCSRFNSTSQRLSTAFASFELVSMFIDAMCSHGWSCLTEHSWVRLLSAMLILVNMSNLERERQLWALKTIRRILLVFDLTSVGDSIMPLVVQLPEKVMMMLAKQHCYEESSVLTGKQVCYSAYFKTLVALACDMQVDEFVVKNDVIDLMWMQKFCLSYRTATALVKNGSLPVDFRIDIAKQLHTLDLLGPSSTNVDEQAHEWSLTEDDQLMDWLRIRQSDWNEVLMRRHGATSVVYVWGHNHRGQLATMDGGAKVRLPMNCEFLAVFNPVQIAGGEQTLFCVCASGKVFACGYGSGGRLGIGGTDSVGSLTVVSGLCNVKIKSIAVSSGGKHCLAIDSAGQLYSWGEGDDGKLGHGSRSMCDRPVLVQAMTGIIVERISAGGAHSACITNRHELFTWGKGRYGRLGHGDSDDQLVPKKVIALSSYHTVDVACGSGDAQTLCLTDDESVWSWGDGDFGKLGRSGSDGCRLPLRIDVLHCKGVIKVECGSQFSAALTKDGAVYTWGKGDYNRLGHGSDEHVREPKLVAKLVGKKVVQLACGSLHCVASTNEGEVFTWGDNDEGQLGDGSMSSSPYPQQVNALQGKHIDRVSCGSAHSMAWSFCGRAKYCQLRVPHQVPSEFFRLSTISLCAIQERLITLAHFTEMFLTDVAMVNLNEDSVFVKLRYLLIPASKENMLRKIIQMTMVKDRQHGPTFELNRVQLKRSANVAKQQTKFIDSIGKTVFGQICEKMTVLFDDALLLPNRVWKVKFIGESVDDCGGGYNESIAEICDELQTVDGPLKLLRCKQDSCFIFNSDLKPSVGEKVKKMWHFFGILLGVAVRTASPLNLHIASPIWCLLVGERLDTGHLAELDESLLKSLDRICAMTSDEFSQLAEPISFTVHSSTGKEISLRAEDDKNCVLRFSERFEFRERVIQFKLHEFDEHVAAVRDGMGRVIPIQYLSLFTGPEFETMVCGCPDVPVHLLKSVAVYKGASANSNLITWFWEILEEFSSTQRSHFLRFVWGRARLPRNLVEFRGKEFVVHVIDKYSQPDKFLPESYTCFFLLKLPRYTNKDSLKDKLVYAVQHCRSIETDDYARVAEFPISDNSGSDTGSALADFSADDLSDGEVLTDFDM